MSAVEAPGTAQLSRFSGRYSAPRTRSRLLLESEPERDGDLCMVVWCPELFTAILFGTCIIGSLVTRRHNITVAGYLHVAGQNR
jgi:hypothetical protein